MIFLKCKATFKCGQLKQSKYFYLWKYDKNPACKINLQRMYRCGCFIWNESMTYWIIHWIHKILKYRQHKNTNYLHERTCMNNFTELQLMNIKIMAVMFWFCSTIISVTCFQLHLLNAVKSSNENISLCDFTFKL